MGPTGCDTGGGLEADTAGVLEIGGGTAGTGLRVYSWHSSFAEIYARQWESAGTMGWRRTKTKLEVFDKLSRDSSVIGIPQELGESQLFVN